MSKLKMMAVGLVVGAIGFGLPVEAQQVVLTQSGTMFQPVPVQPVSQPNNEILGQNLLSQTEPMSENSGILALPKSGSVISPVMPGETRVKMEGDSPITISPFENSLIGRGYIIFDPLTGKTTIKPFTWEEIQAMVRPNPGGPTVHSQSAQSIIGNNIPLVQNAVPISIDQPKVDGLSEVSIQPAPIPASQQMSMPSTTPAIATYSGKLDPVLDANLVNPKVQANLSSSPLLRSRVFALPVD